MLLLLLLGSCSELFEATTQGRDVNEEDGG
jgi:hypothetical protein